MNKIIAILGIFTVLSIHAATINGTVTDSQTGNALSGATVTLFTGGMGGQDTVATVTTGGDGSFEFTSVDTGFYMLDAELAGYITQGMGGYVLVQSPDTTITQDLQLTPEGVIPGDTGVGTVAGTITSAADSSAVEGAQVVLEQRSGGGPGGGRWSAVDSAVTDASGSYTISAVPAGNNYRVSVSGDGFQTTTSSTFSVFSDSTVTVDVSLGGGVPATGVIAGTVYSNTDSTVIEGAAVVLLQGGMGGGLQELATTATDASGEYQFTGLEPSTGGSTGFIMYTVAVGSDTARFIMVENDSTSTVDFYTDPGGVTGINDAGIGSPAGFEFVMEKGALRFTDVSSTLRISIYTPSGRLLTEQLVGPGEAQVVSLGHISSPSMVLMHASDGKSTVNRKIYVP
jgi:hypothetical protein